MWWVLAETSEATNEAFQKAFESSLEAMGFEKLIWFIVLAMVGMTILGVLVDMVIAWIRRHMY